MPATPPALKRSTAMLAGLLLSFVASAAVEQFLPPRHLRASALIHAVCIGVICYSWCRTEARERGTMSPGRSALWAGFFPLVGVPVYMFRTRGARRGAIGTAKALALLAAAAACAIATEELILALRA